MIVLTPQLLIIVSGICGIICRLEQQQNPIRQRVFLPSEEPFPGAAGGYLCWNRCWEQLRGSSSAGAGLELPQQPGVPSAPRRVFGFSPTSEYSTAFVCNLLFHVVPGVLQGDILPSPVGEAALLPVDPAELENAE